MGRTPPPQLSTISHYAAYLSPDELQKAQRYHFEQDRQRYIFGRGILRSILSTYICLPPATLSFEYGPHGKPRLATTSPALEFNLAHSADHFALAICTGADVGIDLEALRPIAEMDSVMQRVFTPAECACIHAQPEAERPRAFFTCWTRKEAVVKASGCGLIDTLNEIDVLAEETNLPDLAGRPSQYWIADLDLGAEKNCCAALSLRGEKRHIVRLNWPVNETP